MRRSASTCAGSMRAADTNVLVRLTALDHPRQVATAQAFVATGAWVSTLVIAEYSWVLAGVYGFDRTRIATAMEMLLGNPLISLQDADLVRVALEIFRSRPAVSFADCLILESARRAGRLPLGTFDKDLGKLDGAEYLRAS